MVTCVTSVVSVYFNYLDNHMTKTGCVVLYDNEEIPIYVKHVANMYLRN